MTKASRLLANIERDGTIQTDIIHARIHEGVFFVSSLYNASLANGSSIEVLVQPAAGQSMHSRVTGRIGGDGEMRLFEGATFSAAGTTITPVNKSRYSSTVAQAGLTSGPTVTGDGTQLDLIYIPGGSGFLLTPGHVSPFFEEWILKGGETYLIRLTNTSGVAQPVEISVDFYEPPDLEGVLS